MKYDKNKSVVENIKDASAVLAFIFMISGAMTSAAFFYLDYRNDQRYLQLKEIAEKLNPIYVTIAALKEQQRVEEIRELESKIFKLEFKQIELAKKTPPQSLSPFEYASLNRYKSQLVTLQAK